MYLTPTKNHWAIDIETDSLDATVIWVATVRNIVTKEEHTLVGHEAIRRLFIDVMLIAYWVTHNGLSLMFLLLIASWSYSRNKNIDTFVLSMLYMPTLPGGHGLGVG
jgi:hypothetical protein